MRGDLNYLEEGLQEIARCQEDIEIAMEQIGGKVSGPYMLGSRITAYRLEVMSLLRDVHQKVRADRDAWEECIAGNKRMGTGWRLTT